MGAAYSSLGRTKVLYATSFVLLGAKANSKMVIKLFQLCIKQFQLSHI